jgi:hypothetical protein
LLRPADVPTTWTIKQSKKGQGVIFSDPMNPGNSVRVMPGDPKSPFPNSQVPYVRWQKKWSGIRHQWLTCAENYSSRAYPSWEFSV